MHYNVRTYIPYTVERPILTWQLAHRASRYRDDELTFMNAYASASTHAHLKYVASIQLQRVNP